jgi:type I restriction enzyme S subunit
MAPATQPTASPEFGAALSNASLPNGWKGAALGNVCRIVSGATPKTAVARYWGGDVAWVTPNDLSKDRSQVVSDGERALSAEGLASCSAQLFPAGSVVVSSRAPVGYVAIAGSAMCTNQGCKTAVPPDYIDSRYLYWFLVNSKADLEARASGTTFKEISGKRFAETRFWWPPVDEQRRIVEILEDHLSRLDSATASLSRAATRLTALDRAARSHARRGTPVPLGDVAEVQGGIQKQPKRKPVRNAYPFLRVANVTAAGLDLRDVHRIEVFDGELERLRLQRGDLLVVEGNGSPAQIGRAATWEGSIADCVHQNHLIRVRAGRGLLPDYLEAVWNSPENRRQLTAIASSTSGLHTLSVAKLLRLVIPLPSEAEQHEVVQHLRDIQDQRRRLDIEIEAARQRADSLRRSLLTAAFLGRLTGQGSETDMATDELARA